MNKFEIEEVIYNLELRIADLQKYLATCPDKSLELKFNWDTLKLNRKVLKSYKEDYVKKGFDADTIQGINIKLNRPYRA